MTGMSHSGPSRGSVPPQSPMTGEHRARIPHIAAALDKLRAHLHRRIVGQEDVVSQVLIALLSEGHCLIVGVPGLAKTLLIQSLAELLSLKFTRIQFTPDLMPSDITGTTIIADVHTGERDFHFLHGPVFTNILLADEINRTPPKTQAALMEAMEETQVSASGRRMPLDPPFFVLATQNPIEQEGTYPLPVSQLDRFLLNIIMDYPEEQDEFRVLILTTSMYTTNLQPQFGREEVLEWIDVCRRIEVRQEILQYASRIVRATRSDAEGTFDFVKKEVSWGAGPRAVQSMIIAAKAVALMDGRSHVEFDDIHKVVVPALRHRLQLRYHAAAEGQQTDAIIYRILEAMPDSRYRPPTRQEFRPETGLAPQPTDPRRRTNWLRRFFAGASK